VKQRLPLWVLDLLLSFLAALGLGAALSAASAGNFWPGWLTFSLLGWGCLFALLRVWRYFGSGKSLAALLAVAFLLRLGVAIFSSVGLPAWGYDNPVNKAGFLYSDAYDRNQSAFQLANSNKPLIQALTAPDITDQYGGLRFISAAIYRFLSPDADRPLLISLLAAFMMALGAAFFWAALQKRWALKIATLAAWILVLFPDSVLLGSSQMREPFLVGLACVAFWAVLGWSQAPICSAVIALVTLAICCVFSLPAGGIFVAILAAIFLLEWTMLQTKPLRRLLGFTALGLAALAALAAGWLWLRTTLYFDSYTTVQQSGWIQKLLTTSNTRLIIFFTTGYGLIQPVLPAAIMDKANLIWKVIAILRGAGWYLILPFLFYSLFSAFKAKRADGKWLVVLFNLVFAIWVVVSSARAGGDQWDNPRYRYILLPLMSLIIAWSIDHYQQTHSRWFWRWVAVAGEFFLFLMNFYLTRYVRTRTKISFPITIVVILVLAVVILASGFIYDRWRSQHPTKPA
jgi:hypothetical protein